MPPVPTYGRSAGTEWFPHILLKLRAKCVPIRGFLCNKRGSSCDTILLRSVEESCGQFLRLRQKRCSRLEGTLNNCRVIIELT